MKLHLPKTLLVAILSTYCVPSVYAGWAADKKTGGYIYWYSDDATEIVAPTDTAVVANPEYATKGDKFTNIFIGSEGLGLTKELTKLSAGDGVSLTVAENPWNSAKNFGDLKILTLEYGAGTGAGSFNITQASSTVTIERVSGSLSSVNNAGTLTIGTAADADAGIDASTTALGGSIVNSGTLTLNGAFTAASFNGFATTTYGTLSNTTHGYADGKTATVIVSASGGTIKTSSDFRFTLGDTDITNSLVHTDGGNVYYIAEDAASSSGTIYEITSAYTTAVEYSGTSGDTAEATGFKLANGTTVKLTGSDYSKLTDGITIAAGNDGSATVSIANGVSQAYASLGLGSLVTKENGSYVLNIDGTGTEITTDNQSGTGFHTAGEISITNGGKLSLNNYDALGWDGGATSKISILNGTLAIGGRQTCSTVINMLGGAVIQATANPLTDSNAPMIQVHSAMEWNVSGTGNVVKNDVKFRMMNTLNLNVANGGELSIQGEFDNGSQLTKSGDGKLVLDGVTKTINGQLQMTCGTLLLGGTEESDGLVTLAGGINHTAGTVQVAGEAAITGDSVLGGALVVGSTGNLTLGKTYTLTGSLSIAEGGRITGAAGMTAGESTAPEAGTNGWDSSIVTVLQTADTNAVNISGLNEIWWTDGNSYSITSSSSEGITSYTADLGVNYYVQDAANKVEYSTESGLTRARTIYMSDNTTLVVKENLSTDKVSIAEGAAVNYEVDGAILNLSSTTIASGISSIDMKNDSMVQLHSAANNLGGENARVAINMSGNSALSLKNGASGTVWADINVDDSGRILGSVYGNNTVVKGSIKGNGSLLLGRSDTTWSNAWKIEALISDNESGKLSVTFDATDGKEGPSQVTLSGANTYSGGTTIENGHLYTENASALGTGGVAVSGTGVLSVAENLKLQDTLQLSGAGKVQVATGKSLNLQDKVSLSSTDGTNAATLTAKANVNALARLQEDASFTIEDMTLTNTTITAATATTQVKLQNVTASNVVLAQGKFTMGETAQVGMGGAGSYDFTTSSLSGITLQNAVADGVSSSTLVVNLGDLSCVSAMGPGKYDLSITLSGFTMQDYTQGIVFAADSWLGQLLSKAENADVQVSFSAVEEATPAAVAEGGAATGVTYSTGSVGTVITITGLNVPEPASATLGLAALMMLCARRRRKA